MNYINKIANDYISVKFFYTNISKYLEEKGIVNDSTIKDIKIEVNNLIKQEQQREQLLDVLLTSCKCIKLTKKSNRDSYIIFHPCIKGYKYQLTFFHNNEPISDICRNNIQDIKEELQSYKDYIVSETIGKDVV